MKNMISLSLFTLSLFCVPDLLSMSGLSNKESHDEEHHQKKELIIIPDVEYLKANTDEWSGDLPNLLDKSPCNVMPSSKVYPRYTGNLARFGFVFDMDSSYIDETYYKLYIALMNLGNGAKGVRFVYSPYFYSFPKQFDKPFVVSHSLYPKESARDDKFEIIFNESEFEQRSKEDFKFKENLKLHTKDEVVKHLRKKSIYVHPSPSRPWLYDQTDDSYKLHFANTCLKLPVYIVYMLNKGHVVETIQDDEKLQARYKEGFVYRDGLDLKSK